MSKSAKKVSGTLRSKRPSGGTDNRYLAPFSPLLFLGLLSLFGGSPCRAALSGRQIYLEKCAECHGAQGEGNTSQYPDPLEGDLPLTELVRLITETMPEDDPLQCVGPEAENVGHYLYDAFYSALAQARHAPAKILLSRLTVRQYENSIADLGQSFTAPDPSHTMSLQGPYGLLGDYYNARHFQPDQHAFQRRDATLDFDFGRARPTVEGPAETGTGAADFGASPEASQAIAQVKRKAKASEKQKEVLTDFSVRWQGSVFAPETGAYEFILETPNGSKLWINDNQVPLIDAWVASGNAARHRASIRLLGGRFYPLQLDLFKHKEQNASIRLKWRPPHRAEEKIPERNLAPVRVAPTLVVQTPFPPDDRSTGYVRANQISQAWDEAATNAALEVATAIYKRLPESISLPKGAADRVPRLRKFCTAFAQRAFRRPLGEPQRDFFVARPFQHVRDDPQELEFALKKSLLTVLNSPRFLYREVRFDPPAADTSSAIEPFDAYDIASWLSFALWDSLPDGPLLEAAATGQLESHEQIAQQAERMIADRRSKAKLHDFLMQWLKLDQPMEILKDRQQFPRFTKDVAADLRKSLDLLLDEMVESESFDFRQLLLSQSYYLNGRLAHFYGIDLPVNAPFQRWTDESGQRVGLLSHPYLLARYAYASTSSPIHRGVWIARSLLGRRLMPPPIAVEPLPPQQHADWSTRQRVASQTRPPMCQTCHKLINPLGFTLENFDAVGRFRDNERGLPVNSAGSYQTTHGEQVRFWSVPELATYLADSQDTHQAFIERLFQFMINQPLTAFGGDALGNLERSFVENDCSIQALLAEIATTSACRVRALERQRVLAAKPEARITENGVLP